MAEADLARDLGERRQGGPFRQRDIVARKSAWVLAAYLWVSRERQLGGGLEASLESLAFIQKTRRGVHGTLFCAGKGHVQTRALHISHLATEILQA